VANQVIRSLGSSDVCRLAGLSLTTLDYWARTGLVEPSIRGSAGRRVERRWSIQDALVVKAIKGLRDAGCPLQRVREARHLLEAHWNEDLSHRVLVWDGADILAIDKWGVAQSLVRRPNQEVLHFVALPLGPWLAMIEAQATPHAASSGKRVAG